MAVCAFLSVFCMRDILLHWWIRFVSMGKKAKLLRSVIIRRAEDEGQTLPSCKYEFFWFKESGPMWRMRGDSGCLLIISVQNTNV